MCQLNYHFDFLFGSTIHVILFNFHIYVSSEKNLQFSYSKILMLNNGIATYNVKDSLLPVLDPHGSTTMTKREEDQLYNSFEIVSLSLKDMKGILSTN